jgi:HTH-type transcriptional regulator / antitoxin HigA
MTESNAPFRPDWVSAPGESILDLVDERGWTQAELAERLGYTEKHVSQLINGKVPMSMDAALRLERVLGSTADFWLALETNYQKHKARLKAITLHESSVAWLDELPLKELMASGAISKQRIDVKNRPGLVEACLRFFGVASPDEWRGHYGGMQVAFRRSRAEQSDIGAISAWLRLGEREAEKLDGPKYDRERFVAALRTIRGLTRDTPQAFEPKIRGVSQDCGVLFVLVPSIPRAHVSGVARWLNGTRPLIQLSLYGKTNDKFWFTFFHEAAHILLHANSKDEKKSVFLDDTTSKHVDNPQEIEANEWAGRWLIPESYERALAGLKTKAAVVTFSEQLGIHAGIVVGRLQHDGLIDPSWMNELKQSFRFRDSSAEI